METDSDKECRRYDALIQSLGGIDLQLHPDFTLIADTAALSLADGIVE